MPDIIKKRAKAADGLFSTAVSRIRQPTEAIINWPIEKQISKKPARPGRQKA